MRSFGIDPAAVAAVPEITEMLAKYLSEDGKPPSRLKIFNFLAASDAKDVKRFLESSRAISDKPLYESLPMEALCVLAEVSPLKILSTVATIAKRMKSAESAFQSLSEDDEAELDAADEAWDRAFPSISSKLNEWSENRRKLSEV